MPFEKPVTLADWLKTTDTGDIQHDMAAMYGRYMQALGQSLNLQKESMGSITDNITTINDLTTRTRSYQPTKGEGDKGIGPETPTFLGKDKAESQALINALEAAGVNIDHSKIDKNANPSWKVPKQLLDIWIADLQGKSDNFSSESQQQQSQVSQTLQRFTQAAEAASTQLKGRATAHDSPIANIRS